MTSNIHLRKPHSRLVEIPVKSKIALTAVEDQICTLLDECTQKLKEEKGITTSCRIAGGWVRDKVN
jgi:tRNA nucleotidyltransferase (CCA-adding enzyme)